MIFLQQEKSIPVKSKVLVYGTHPNTTTITPNVYIPPVTFYFIAGIISILFIYFAIKKYRPFNASKCPSCKKRLMRTKRKQGDYLVSIMMLNMLKLRRYKCKNCSWQGLRVKYTTSKSSLLSFSK